MGVTEVASGYVLISTLHGQKYHRLAASWWIYLADASYWRICVSQANSTSRDRPDDTCSKQLDGCGPAASWLTQLAVIQLKTDGNRPVINSLQQVGWNEQVCFDLMQTELLQLDVSKPVASWQQSATAWLTPIQMGLVKKQRISRRNIPTSNKLQIKWNKLQIKWNEQVCFDLMQTELLQLDVSKPVASWQQSAMAWLTPIQMGLVKKQRIPRRNIPTSNKLQINRTYDMK